MVCVVKVKERRDGELSTLLIKKKDLTECSEKRRGANVRSAPDQERRTTDELRGQWVN